MVGAALAARAFRRCWWAQTGHRSDCVCAKSSGIRKPGGTKIMQMGYHLLHVAE